jgi:Glycosyltransferases involved in cell wall biogenesis
MNSLLVSIIIPTYNRADLILETLDSILKQSYQNWECLVVDDGSTDNTKEVIEKFQNTDNRFKYCHRPGDYPKGANACRNYGIEISKGDLIQFLDSDDLISSDKFSQQVDLIISENADVSICSWGRLLKNNKKQIKKSEIYKNFEDGLELIECYGEYNTFLPVHSFLIKKSIIKKSGYWNEWLKINQDGEFFCRVLINAKKIVFEPASFVWYRFVEDFSTSKINTLEHAKHLILSWRLISNYLIIIDESRFNQYLENSKEYVFESLQKEYLNVLIDNKYFFKKQFKNKSFFKKL